MNICLSFDRFIIHFFVPLVNIFVCDFWCFVSYLLDCNAFFQNTDNTIRKNHRIFGIKKRPEGRKRRKQVFTEGRLC